MSTNWKTVSAGDVENALVAAPAIATAALSGTDDVLATLIPDIMDEVRGEIMSRNYPISATPETVPPELRRTAIYLVVAALLSRLPEGAVEVPSTLTDQIKDARARIKRLREGAFAFTAASDPGSLDGSSPQENTPSPNTAPRCREFTRYTEDGI